MLIPLPGGMYDTQTGGVPALSDMPYLLDADSHHHVNECAAFCPRQDLIIRAITDDGDPFS